MRRRINLDFFTPVEAELEEIQIGDWKDDYDSQSSDRQLAKLQAELAEAMEQERYLREAQLQRIEAQQQRIQEARQLAKKLQEVEQRINSLL
jgi:hypothetical protein